MTKLKATAQLIGQALAAGVDADYVLMDTWFTEEPFIKEFNAYGLDVSSCYIYENELKF